MRTHRTNANDWWDLVACIAYGEKPLDDHQMDRVLEANPDLIFTKQLAANIVLNIPEPGPSQIIPLVPWTNANL